MKKIRSSETIVGMPLVIDDVTVEPYSSDEPTVPDRPIEKEQRVKNMARRALNAFRNALVDLDIAQSMWTKEFNEPGFIKQEATKILEARRRGELG